MKRLSLKLSLVSLSFWSLVAQATEDQIPLTPVADELKAAAPSADHRLLLGLLLFLGFATLAALAVRKFKFKNVKTQQFQMKILSQFHLSPKKSLAVIQVAGESILVGVTDHHISLIKSLSLLDEDLEQGASSKDFKHTLGDLGDIGKQGTGPGGFESSDIYSIQKIQDAVSLKIKNLRTF